ncbi:MAG TPA: hypothetical protein VGK93_07000 [Candidatus Eisenbacteria bacterium]
MFPDGKIDFAAADRAWNENIRPRLGGQQQTPQPQQEGLVSIEDAAWIVGQYEELLAKCLGRIVCGLAPRLVGQSAERIEAMLDRAIVQAWTIAGRGWSQSWTTDGTGSGDRGGT